MIEDWTRALQFYHLSSQSFCSVFDQTHPKYLHVQRLIETTKTKAEGVAKMLATNPSLPQGKNR